jgi:hypothetical protein
MTVALFYAGGISMVVLTVGMAWLSDRPVDHFTRDPLAVMGAPAYVGFLSNITAMTWFAAASGACLTAIVLAPSNVTRRRGIAMAAGAGMLALLGIDDLFMIHEELLQRHFGVPENFTMAGYTVCVAISAVAFRDVWRTSPWLLLVPAAVFLGASVAVDVLTSGFGWRVVVEDCLKFLGVVAACAWVVATAIEWLAPRAAPVEAG